MEDGMRLLGGSNPSSGPDLRVIEAGDELQLGNIDPELSHLSNDSCSLCKKARDRGASYDAPEADRTRLARSA